MEDNWRHDGRYAALSDPFGMSDVRYRVTDGEWASAAYLPVASRRGALGWLEVQAAGRTWERLTV